jgi:hypothetical protein
MYNMLWLAAALQAVVHCNCYARHHQQGCFSCRDGGGWWLSIMQVCRIVDLRVVLGLGCLNMSSSCWEYIRHRLPYAALGKHRIKWSRLIYDAPVTAERSRDNRKVVLLAVGTGLA